MKASRDEKVEKLARDLFVHKNYSIPDCFHYANQFYIKADEVRRISEESLRKRSQYD